MTNNVSTVSFASIKNRASDLNGGRPNKILLLASEMKPSQTIDLGDLIANLRDLMRRQTLLLILTGSGFILPYLAGYSAEFRESRAAQSSVEQSTHSVQAAKDFQIDGVRLGMTPDEFRARFPTVKRYDEITDAAEGLIAVRVGSTERSDGIDAVFSTGVLVEYGAWYFSEKLDALGGEEQLLRHLVARFGPPNADPEGAAPPQLEEETSRLFSWNIPEAHFALNVSATPIRTFIHVIDTRVSSFKNSRLQSTAAVTGQNRKIKETEARFTADQPAKVEHEVLLKVPHVKQGIDMCVPASASAAIRFYGERESPEKIKRLADSVASDRDFPGTYFIDLVNGIRTIGFEWEERYFKVTDKGFEHGLREIIQSLNEQKPVLVDTNIPPVGHTVLVVGYNNETRQLILLDPNIRSPGLRRVSYGEFKESWYSLTAHIRGAIFTKPKS